MPTGPISGKIVLVTGAAGGVGQYAVQLAKWGGAIVVATESTAEKAAQARAIGADHVVSYRDEDVAARVLELRRSGWSPSSPWSTSCVSSEETLRV